jgi:hypothetical protein
MGRRTAARVVPTAEVTASVPSSNSALVFTHVVPVDPIGDDRESGAASRARGREDGKEYVSRPPSPMRSSLKSGTFLFLRRAVEVVLASSSDGIEEPAPAQPTAPSLASPGASAGNSCSVPCEAHFSLATLATRVHNHKSSS